MRCFAFVIGVLVSVVASGGEVADVLQKLVGECPETAEPAPGSPESIEQTQPSFFVRADVDHANREYHEGDRLAISVLSEADAYLYVLYKQVDGKIYLIFPNSAQPENQVKARTEVSVPARNDTFRWVVEPPFGRETVKVIASRTPLQELADPAFRQERFNKVSQETVKGMRVELVDQEVTSWAEDTIELAILPRSESPVPNGRAAARNDYAHAGTSPGRATGPAVRRLLRSGRVRIQRGTSLLFPPQQTGDETRRDPQVECGVPRQQCPHAPQPVAASRRAGRFPGLRQPGGDERELEAGRHRVAAFGLSTRRHGDRFLLRPRRPDCRRQRRRSGQAGRIPAPVRLHGALGTGRPGSTAEGGNARPPTDRTSGRRVGSRSKGELAARGRTRHFAARRE